MKPRSAVAVVLLAALGWFVVSRLAGPGGTRGSPTPPGRSGAGFDLVEAVGDGAAQIASWLSRVAANGAVLAGILTVVALVVIVRAVRARMPVAQDPQRMYSPDQRREAFARAGNRCEYTGLFPWSRCRQLAEHADHLFPWSRGGATTLTNCVASCARHNTSKGAKILPRWQVRALVRRRRRYFPPGVDTAVGEKYADVVASGVAVR